MGIVKINQKGNILIPKEAIQPFLTFEIGKEFKIMTEEEYNNSTEPKMKGALVLVPLKESEETDIPF